MLRQLLRHTSNYTIGNILLVAAGLISFPILTRILDVDEYGVMSLIATALSLLVGFGKLGMQHATLRFYSEIEAGKRDILPAAFSSTVFPDMCAVGAATALVWALASQLVPSSWWSDARIRPLMLLSSVLIWVRVVDSALVNQLRAQERSGTLLIYGVLRRYASLALLLAVLFYWAGDVWGFYGATIAGELLATLFMAIWMFRHEPPRPGAFSMPLLKAMLAFGIPMIGYELSSVVLSMGDRYIIQHLLGTEQLGVYSAAYNMCEYLKLALFASLVAAAQPMYMRLWESSGAAETAAFLARFMRIYVMASMLIVAGMSAVGHELLGFLASDKYRSGADIIPYVLGGMAIETVLIITGAGLYIQKRSKTIVVLVMLCAVINLVLNYLLIPRLGLIGPAVATLVSYALLMVIGTSTGRRILPIEMPWGALAKFGTIACVMYLAVTRINLHDNFKTMLARMAAGLIIYAALTLSFDSQARSALMPLRRKLGLSA